jgi:hypothetical protein
MKKITIRKLSQSEKKKLYSDNFPEKIEQHIFNSQEHISGNCFVKTVDEYKWKKYNKENKKTILEIEKKKKRISPLWNKGAAMYITEKENLQTIGKKI